MKPLTLIDPSRCTFDELFALESAGFDVVTPDLGLIQAIAYQTWRTDRCARMSRDEHAINSAVTH